MKNKYKSLYILLIIGTIFALSGFIHPAFLLLGFIIVAGVGRSVR